MKKSIGIENQNPARDARNAQRASRAASGGIGVPCSALARVHAINLFWTRQIIPHAFSSINNPIPPPMLMDKCAFDDSGLAFNTSTAQHAARAITTIAVTRTHELSRIPVCGSWKG